MTLDTNKCVTTYACAFLSSVACTQPSLGQGDDANFVTTSLDKIKNDMMKSHTFGGVYDKIQSELIRVKNEYSEPNWDGYDASPVSVKALENAMRFAKALPFYTAVPDVCVDPDGDIVFEWYKSPYKLCSISVSAESKLYCASTIGQQKTALTETFENTIPPLTHVAIDSVIA